MNIPALNFRPVLNGGTLVRFFDKSELNIFEKAILSSKRNDLVICDIENEMSLHFLGGYRKPDKESESVFCKFGLDRIYDISDFWDKFDELKSNNQNFS